MKRFCLTLDLKNDPLLVEEYIKHHQNVWPEIQKSISDAGILAMEIYHVANRLFMIIEANESFSFEEKQKMDAGNPRVAEWENLMDQYQERLSFAKSNEKWVLMEKIFVL